MFLLLVVIKFGILIWSMKKVNARARFLKFALKEKELLM